MLTAIPRKYLTPFIHLLGWAGYFVVPVILESTFDDDSPQMYLDPIWLLVQFCIVSFFYLNYLLYIPRLMLHKRYFVYGLTVLGTLTIMIFSIEFFIQSDDKECFDCPEISEQHMPMPDKDMMNEPSPPPHHDSEGPLRGLSIFTIVFVISTGLRMTGEWYKNDMRKRVLENEVLKAELSSLKAQINPHFFFNVLNNICSLARKKSDDTETFIIKLSQLVRYNLYDEKGDKVMLSREISFLNDYIDLQKMRLGNQVQIFFQHETTDGNQSIEPMLLFPFVENAFKHGISYKKPSDINIEISTSGKNLTFKVKNFISASEQLTKSDASGIGLANVKRRLELLYLNKHQLNINKTEDTFEVVLNIDLS